ncbi:MAG TPA: NAD-dependent deacylase [Caldisericia bacterium]|nr:NAD-dependent deacylase [Caldisericia bacterium]HPF49545.1 NAD-dependent deacylase [Caldisericia bacterium]HPI84161.1 NAD-dependent deacylase [Caldisericia bacterium]HPQ93544.1 NAD-dependent deacylase [Caldisericia bacterium]HRV75450.1 NAD-dependent deacylase [Caldisericia bacterium]
MDFIVDVAELLKGADSVAVLTGAGISAESGVGTFRDASGIWNKLDPSKWATEEGFRSSPSMVWEWYQDRRKIIKDASPNKAHYSLVSLEKLGKKVTISTQNIDNLHQQAGSKNVLELHGNIFRNKCIECGKPYAKEIMNDELCKCEFCGGIIRPDVVWYGEQLPQDVWQMSEQAAIDSSIYLVIGTSGAVYPAAGLAILAKRAGSTVVIINTEPTELDDYADFVIREKAGIAMPEITARIR